MTTSNCVTETTPNTAALRPVSTDVSVTGFFGTVRYTVLAAMELLLTWQERANQRFHLQQMSDHMLKDVGISRADVHMEASKPFWKS